MTQRKIDTGVGPSRPVLLATAVMAGSLLSSCGGTDEMRWQEEVRLHDKSFIVLERYAKRASYGFPNSERGPVLLEELRSKPMAVAWSSQGSQEEPISFDVIDEVAYLVTVPASRSKFCEGKPAAALVAYVYEWRNGVKQQVAPEKAPFEAFIRNLSGTSHWGDSKQTDPTYMSSSDVLRATHQSIAPEPLTAMFQSRNWLRCK